MNIGLEICFSKSFYQQGFYKRLIDEYVKFTPTRFMYKNAVAVWDNKKHYKKIENYSSENALSISNDQYCYFFTMLAGLGNPYRSVKIVQDKNNFFPSDQEMEDIINHEEFIAAFLYNEDYECIQSTSAESNLGSRYFSPEIANSIKNTPFRIGLFDVKFYDTKFNPGRTIMTNSTTLMVAWKIWFGKEFFKIIPKEKILSFPFAKEIKELPNGSVFVQLYNNVDEPYTPDNIFIQWKWREWLGYEDLEVI